MQGYRVAHHKKNSKSQKRQVFLPTTNTPRQFIKSLIIILNFIGKPFYLLLINFLILLFFTISHFGKVVIDFVLLFIILPRIVLLKFSKLKLIKIKKKKKKPVKKIKNRYKLLFLILIFVTVSWLSFWVFLLRDLPKPGVLTTRNQAISTKIYDRNGLLLYKIYKNQNRSLVHFEQIPKYVKLATIAIEDEDFYSHAGFSIRGITRAFYKNFTRGELAGGSTITQQLVKTTLLSPEKTMIRKIKEIILAIEVEIAFSKNQILEMYLNEVSYGGSSYGIEEASQTYFGKHVKDITLAESALLAGLTQRPTAYSPFGTNPKLAQSRQKEVLEKMYQLNYISLEQKNEAENETLVFAKQQTNILAPHFVMYIKQILAEKYGDEMVEEGGLEVTTSLDLTTQNMAQLAVSDEVDKIKGLNINNGAALVTNPQTGEILAMVGSKDYFNQTIDGNVNLTVAERQPGSSIKPVNYSYAIESGLYNSSSLILDAPVTYNVPGSPPYSPRNYDNSFRGNVPLRTALGSSLNIPAVKILASYGVKKMVEQGQKLGITTWNDPSRFGLSLTLGAGEVKMTDMAVVYGTFANYGRRVDLKPILEIVDAKGQILQDNNCSPVNTVDKPKEDTLITKLVQNLKPKIAYAEEAPAPPCGRQVLNQQTAFIITDILRDNWARTPTFGPRSKLVINKHPEIAVKTGTTQNLRDNWTIGYNQKYTVLTWVGNNDNEPMSYVASGVTGASPIWNKIMTSLVENTPSFAWKEPEGIVKADVCLGSSVKKDYFILGHEPKNKCVIKPPELDPNNNSKYNLQGQIL